MIYRWTSFKIRNQSTKLKKQPVTLNLINLGDTKHIYSESTRSEISFHISSFLFKKKLFRTNLTERRTRPYTLLTFTPRT